MYHFNVERNKCQWTVHFFYLCIILMLGVGLVTLYSSSYAFAQRQQSYNNNGNYLIVKQIKFSALWIVLFFVISKINLGILRKWVIPLLGLAAVLCVLTLVPGIGKVEWNGASRWIEIGPLSYQPSEAVKFILPLYLAHLLDKKSGNIDNFYSGVLPPVLVTGLFFILIYIQNSFSTAVFVVLNALVIFFLAGMRLRYFLAALAIILPISALLVFTKEHRVWRLISFLRPEWDLQGTGFQVNASRDAIISGGLWGKGIGEGTFKIASVPEVHSDFIFSAYAEETGFIGIILFFIMFAAFAILGYRAAWRSETVFGRLLAAGLTTMLVSQALLNVAVVSGALPATGVPLPFFSAGGSSLLTTLVSAGAIINVAANNGKNAGAAAGSAARNTVYNDSEDEDGF